MINTLLICLIAWICFLIAKDGTVALAKQREKIAPEILRLSDELLG